MGLMFVRFALAASMALACAAQDLTVARVIDIAPVWAGHPVGFALLTHKDRQYVAFYDAGRRMTVAARALDSDRWDMVRLPSQVGWDSHNSITMTFDRAGCLHLSGNMHVAPLVYFRTAKPYDIHTFERLAMTGKDETRCTYPHFLRNGAGDLIFTYRDGKSGDGNQIYNIYDEQSRTWQRLIDRPFTDGEGHRNAYFVGPTSGPDGWFHLIWTWRESPDCATNHDLSYARSKDLVHWETSVGKPLALPITLATAEIIDRVPVHGGMINGNTKIGFDSRKRVVVSYHKFDSRGFTQIMNARLEPGGWKIYQTSDWEYRWDFGGGGSIPFEIRLSGVRNARQEFEHAKYGAGVWKLDEETLRPLATLPRERQWPAELDKVQSGFPGMRVHVQRDGRYLLRWETLGENRDRPRTGPLPDAGMMRIYELR
jgi:hypothetical protein